MKKIFYCIFAIIVLLLSTLGLQSENSLNSSDSLIFIENRIKADSDAKNIYGIANLVDSQTCVIVSNAGDSGLGSFRNAIQIVNANPLIDTIKFGCEFFEGCYTINIGISPMHDDLPAICDSNVVIDGTNSNCLNREIVINGNYINTNSKGLILEAPNCEIYSLIIFGFDIGIHIRGKNSKIGDVNKGNTIINNELGIFNEAKNSVIKSNLIGHFPLDTECFQYTNFQANEKGIFVAGTGDSIQIGGYENGEENIISGNELVGIEFHSWVTGGLVINNKIGSTDLGDVCLGNGQSGIHLDQGAGPFQPVIGIYIEGNVICGSQYGVLANGDTSAKHCSITKNSFFCNSMDGILFNNTINQGIMPPLIQSANVHQVSGISGNNERIEFFIHDDTGCLGVPCQGKFYLGYTISDNNGNWQFNVSNSNLIDTNDVITATATDIFGNTSKFTDCFSDIEQCDIAVNIIDLGNELTCDIPNLTLNASSSSQNVNYIWTSSNGNIISGQNTMSSIIDASGTYQIKVTDINTGCRDSSCIEITQDVSAPTLLLSTSDSVLNCSIDSINILAEESSELDSVDFLWGNGQMNSSITVNSPNDYFLTVTNLSNGCAIDTMISIFQDTIAPIILPLSTVTELTCINNSIPLTAANSTSLDSFVWSTGNTTPYIDISNPANYGVTVTNTSNGCTSNSSVTISQDTISPNVVISVSNTFLTCLIISSTIDASQSVGQGVLDYTWSNGSTFNSIEVDTPNTYTVTLIDDDNGCSSTASINIFEDLFDSIPETAIDTTITVTRDSEVEFQVMTNDNISSYSLWSMESISHPEFGALSQIDSLTFKYTAPLYTNGVESFQYKICNNRCPELCDTATVFIVTEPKQTTVDQLFIPEIFTPNGDDKNEHFVIPDLKYFPVNELTILNRWGNVVYYNPSYNNDWNGDQLPSGTYFYLLKLGDNKNDIQKGRITILR